MANQFLLQVSISGGSAIERARIALLLTSFPGIAVIPVEAWPPTRLMIWIAGSDLSQYSVHPLEYLLLALTDQAELPRFLKKWKYQFNAT